MVTRFKDGNFWYEFVRFLGCTLYPILSISIYSVFNSISIVGSFFTPDLSWELKKAFLSSLSHEKKITGWLGYIGDGILPSYIVGIARNHEIRIPMNQPG